MPQVSCLGICVVDALSGPLAQYPVPRVRTLVATETIRFLPGGGAANSAGALGRMGLSVGIFSKVGDDSNGAFLIRELEACGVDTGGIRVSAVDATPFTFVGIHPDGERTFIHTPGANKTFGLTDLSRDRLLEADFLLYQDLWVLPNMDGRPGASILEEARQRGVVTLLDECWGFGPNREILETMLPHCDYALPSLDDLRAVYPGMSAGEIADHVLGFGVKAVILKMGSEGCLVATEADKVQIPAFPVEVVDATGAGDCWDAGFIAGLAHDEDLAHAARLGNACAAFCLGAVGGATGVPSYSAVRERASVGTGS